MSADEPVPPDMGEDHRMSVLDRIARQHARALARFFMRRVDDRSEVPDLVQDVFFRLSRLKDLSTIEKPEQYVFATAASALRDRQRRQGARGGRAHETFDEYVHGRSDLSPERVLAGKQAVEQLRAALRELPERTRDVFVLRVFEDMKMADIARAMGVSQRAVEKHYVKALAYVTERLRGAR
jgi:RNA polymerase sigma-70 factor (ECF subfamily)